MFHTALYSPYRGECIGNNPDWEDKKKEDLQAFPFSFYLVTPVLTGIKRDACERLAWPQSGQVGLGLFSQCSKRYLVKHRDISQDLAIDIDFGFFQTVNE